MSFPWSLARPRLGHQNWHAMSASGQDLTSGCCRTTSALPPGTDIGDSGCDVRFGPEGDFAASANGTAFTERGISVALPASLLGACRGFSLRYGRTHGS